jgi:hypothetical protein
MSTKTSFTYTVLRYVHDIATGEFLNVGVAIHAPERRFVNVLCRTTYKRLKDVFPSLDGDSFRGAMRHITRSFEAFSEEARDQLPLRSGAGSVMDFALAVLPKDDSSLQWSPAGSGLTRDPEATLEQLFERLVMGNDVRGGVQRKQDDDVWRHFSLVLQQRQLLKHFEPKTIAVRDDELEFKHAWKNGVWHCLAPVSFDLATPDSIKDKAHKWLGQVASVAKANDRFRLYFLVAEPSHPDLRPAYDSALSILKKSPVDSEVFAEAEAPVLSERLAAEVAAHLSAG